MKLKKLLLPSLIIVAAIFAMSVCSVIGSIAKKPVVTEKDFAFSITYELNGETKTIQDIYSVHYDGNSGYADTKSRIYVGKIGNMSEGTTSYVIQGGDTGERLVLFTNFYADYMMGDSDGDYFDESPFEPEIFYYDSEEIEYSDEDVLLEKGVKLISWEYPTPIENSFVFSHLSIFSGEVVFPTLLIGVLACVVILIFVKKDIDLTYKTVHIISKVFNCLIALVVIPFFSISAMLSDVTGDNDSIFHQIFYFIPALTSLCIAASVALRRKDFGKSSLVVQFIGPAIFVLDFILYSII